MTLAMARPISVPGSPFPYSRLVVPKDVRPLIGRTEWKEPRREATEAERLRVHGARIATWKGEIAAARARLSGDLQALTLRQIEALCGRWYREQWAQYAENPGEADHWDREIEFFLSDVVETIEPGIPETQGSTWPTICEQAAAF